jgi:phosphate starvation-inducible PhoH-like protein
MEKTIEIKGVDLSQLFGPADANLKMVEDAFPSNILVRGNTIKINGEESEVMIIHEIFHEMSSTLNRKGSLTQGDLRTLINVTSSSKSLKKEALDSVVHYGRKGRISGRTKGQQAYIDTVNKNDVAFSVGPAGTGKTYLAVAFAVAALDNREVDRIIFCRPAVEAGENLGFLPGDLKEKVDPYLTPLYDALGDMMPNTRLKPLLANNTIGIIPLAYMRGRTLNNAFMILDEAQNATTMQMKMFLTRLGVNSRAIITGDITQIDLPSKTKSGLLQVIDLLQGIDGIGFCKLDASDIVRHKLVRDIIKAYDQKDD